MVNTSFSLFPNPSFGAFTVQASGAGILNVYTLPGQMLRAYRIAAGKTDMQLPVNIAAGIYLGIFKPDNGGINTEVRLVYQP